VHRGRAAGPVLRIEERIAPDRGPRIGFGNLTELHSDVAFVRIRAHSLREHANADLELGGHLIEHRLMIEGIARHHDYIADAEARRSRHLVETLVRPDRILPPITRSTAAVTISLEADESARAKKPQPTPAELEAALDDLTNEEPRSG
jgi:hypothetical protein